MAKNDNLHDFLKDIADAIRSVQGIDTPINPQDFADIIRGFSSGSSGLTFPIYLYTEELDSDFRRRSSDDTAVAIINWYDNNRVSGTNSGHYLPSDVLAGKLFVDDFEVTSFSFQPSIARDILILETNNDYGMNSPWMIMQYTASSSIARGTLDVMENG